MRPKAIWTVSHLTKESNTVDAWTTLVGTAWIHTRLVQGSTVYWMVPKVPSKLKVWFYLSIQSRVHFFCLHECYRCYSGFCLLASKIIRRANTSVTYKARVYKISQIVILVKAKYTLILYFASKVNCGSKSQQLPTNNCFRKKIKVNLLSFL